MGGLTKSKLIASNRRYDRVDKWDKYFMDLCDVVASKSQCLSRKIGALIVKDKSIISTGYNGPPRGIPHCGIDRILSDSFLYEELLRKNNKCDTDTCPRRLLGYKSGEGLMYCIAAHAERNCLINAARMGVSTLNTVLYLNTGVPCKDCLIELINAGIVEIVVKEYNFYDEVSKWLIEQSNIRVRKADLD